MPSGSLQPTVEDAPEDDFDVASDGVQHLALRDTTPAQANVRAKRSHSGELWAAPSDRTNRHIELESDSGYSSYAVSSRSDSGYASHIAASSRSDRSSSRSVSVERRSMSSQAERRRVSFVQPTIIEDQRQTIQPRVEVGHNGPRHADDPNISNIRINRRSLPPVITQAFPSGLEPAGVPYIPPPFPRDKEIDLDSEYSGDYDESFDEPASQRGAILERQSIVVPNRKDRREPKLYRPGSFIRSSHTAYPSREPRHSSHHGYISHGTVVQPAKSSRRKSTVAPRQLPEQPTRRSARYYKNSALGYRDTHEDQFQDPLPLDVHKYWPESSNFIEHGIGILPQAPPNSPQNVSPISDHNLEPSTGLSKELIIGLPDWYSNSSRGYRNEHDNQPQKAVKTGSPVTGSITERTSNHSFEPQFSTSKTGTRSSHSDEREHHVLFKVDSDAPLSQNLDRDFEGRQLQLLPADEGGVPELPVADRNLIDKSSEDYSEKSPDPDVNIKSLTEICSEPHILTHAFETLRANWKDVWDNIPDIWKWDLEYHTIHEANGKGHGCWNCTPMESDEPRLYPLTIASVPVVLPVEYQWPPVGGLNPPPDPRPSTPIDCRNKLPLELVRDLFLTFTESIGFYILISGLIQVIVPSDFDTEWASSHLPHKYGGLKVCYIQHNLEPTMWPSSTEMAKPAASSRSTPEPSTTNLIQRSQVPIAHPKPSLKINDFIEARSSSAHGKEKFSGRIGLKVLKENEPYLIMSTHIITEAIVAKSSLRSMFGRSRHRVEKLNEEWNDHVDIWAGNEKIGRIDRSFDTEAEIYPNGFQHDITLIKPDGLNAVKDIASPVNGIGWLDHESWMSLRQQLSAIRILGPTEDRRAAKSIRCSRPSEILVVGEGIFRNQTAATGSKTLKDHDMSTWKDLVSRALLYRVHPDFDPPNGYSGVALYADGIRHDGTEGPGIVGFQSFVQRSGHVQNFEMEGTPLDKRLQLGRIAFYGAFEVPQELKRDYTIA